MTPSIDRTWGAQSMVAPLREVLVKRPGAAFGAAFDDPAVGFLRPVDLDRAQREHDGLVEALEHLGTRVHVLDDETDDPDLVYVFDPMLIADGGAIPLRPGKPNRRDEPAVLEAWTSAHGIPTLGRIDGAGTVEGGDTFWLRPDLLCIGRTLRTNDAGARQLASIVGGDAHIFDLPYWKGPAELVHLLSVISPVADDLAVVFLPLLPAGLYAAPRRSRRSPGRGAGGGVRHAWLQRAGGAPRGGPRRTRQPGDPAAAGGSRVRGARGAAGGGRRERIGRRDLPDPTGAAGVSKRSSRLRAGAEAAAAAVDADALAAELAALVRIPSITGDEDAIQAYLADRLDTLGMTVEVFHPDPAAIRGDVDWPGEEVARTSLPVVIGRVGRAGGVRVVLSGHVDVVPTGDPATWSEDPWSGEIHDGHLHGRGACDMKGGVASILGALRALAVSGALERLQGELIVALVPSEEDGGQGTLAAIRAGATGDLCIIPEPSNLDVVIAHAGAITFRLTVPGRAAHASRRTEGVSALDNLQMLVRALELDEAQRNAEETEPLMTALGLPYPTIIGKVSGGEWASTVMDQVVAEGRYGVRLGQTPAAAAVELRACIARACAFDEFLRAHPATVEVFGAEFGTARVPADHQLPVGLASVAACRHGPPARDAGRAVRRGHAPVQQHR